MDWDHLSCFFCTLSLLTLCTKAQQNYSANSILTCKNNDTAGPSPAFLYTCNGQSTCLAYLIFTVQPPFDSVLAISALTSSDPLVLARINNMTVESTFPLDQEVIVPVHCSCVRQYYQANATFTLQSRNQTYFVLANNTYHGMATCDALKQANPYSEYGLVPGLQLQVPLRCACPTKNQAANGTKYLLTYSVVSGDKVPDIGMRFDASVESIVVANGFSDEKQVLFPFTTILVPQKTEPSSLYTIIQKHKSRIPRPPSSTVGKKKSKRKFYIGVAVVASFFLMIFVVIATLCFYTKKGKGVSAKLEDSQKDIHVEIASFEQGLRAYSFEELQGATENFSLKSEVKNSVYKGFFGEEILAIKKMSLDVSKEVNMLNKINHFNLIKLHGICKKDDCFYLVYEYMNNGSLRDWIRKRRSTETDSWTTQIQMALDIANGLLYLHNFTKPAYVHKDIKSSNILLDHNLRAKISNFSHARIAMDSNTQTTSIAGTKGYMAPEYLETGSITTKIDVYAFGVVMLELVTGKDAVFMLGDKEVLLTSVILPLARGENEEIELSNFISPLLGENEGLEYALRMIKLSLVCLSRDPAGRPSMSEVVSSLVKIQIDFEKS